MTCWNIGANKKGPLLKTVVLHIGPHKTGTTSLQAALRAARDELSSVGVLYPTTGAGRTDARIRGQHNLAWSTLGDHRQRPELGSWSNLRTEIDKSDCSHVLISSEAFSRLDREGVESVRKELRGYDVRVVYVVRRHEEIVLSVFGMTAARWNTLSAADFFEKYINEEMTTGQIGTTVRTFLHRPKLEPWIETFGKDAARILVYDTMLPDYVGSIAAAVPIPQQLPEIRLEKLNTAKSLPHIGIVTSVCRALEGLMSAEEFDVELAPHISNRFSPFAESLPRLRGLPDESISQISARAAADVEWLAQYVELPSAWKARFRKGTFIEPEVPGERLGQLLAADFLTQRIAILDEVLAKKPSGPTRDKVMRRKTRLQQISAELMVQ